MVTDLANPIPQTMKDKLYYNIGGMVADAGETIDVLKDYFWYQKLDSQAFMIKLAEEGSDVLHWLQAMCNTVGLTLEDLMRVNHAKLSVRYPDGFTKQAAAVRDKQAEWEAMKNALRGPEDS